MTTVEFEVADRVMSCAGQYLKSYLMNKFVINGFDLQKPFSTRRDRINNCVVYSQEQEEDGEAPPDAVPEGEREPG